MMVQVNLLGFECVEDLALGFQEFQLGHADPEGHSDGAGRLVIIDLEMKCIFDRVGALVSGGVIH